MNLSKINPATLKITDMRFADIDGAPKRCTLLKLYTNQGIVGYGEVRDASSRTYAAMLKSRILGENPCNVEKIFRRIKQFGGDSRQAGGVCAVELACWDICGKAWGVPVWQLLGGKWRDEIRCYCDTDSTRHGPGPQGADGDGLHVPQDGSRHRALDERQGRPHRAARLPRLHEEDEARGPDAARLHRPALDARRGVRALHHGARAHRHPHHRAWPTCGM